MHQMWEYSMIWQNIQGNIRIYKEMSFLIHRISYELKNPYIKIDPRHMPNCASDYNVWVIHLIYGLFFIDNNHSYHLCIKI